ncbi:hypothetical protein AKJ45_00965 [candidate division MSBL1 archaeon SCGC-AAA261F19]|uniref:Uncharacterized protein n=1 Tax=candidate division MSBL1 archaeon SCGC-AAA261F19 TaxID=1698275 RepID=A0A133VB27_9EURY|nr:hypothetical protein AKJ45_00965 [candidate division MSBL1 archaeon SCGC-AAA261F19]
MRVRSFFDSRVFKPLLGEGGLQEGRTWGLFGVWTDDPEEGCGNPYQNSEEKEGRIGLRF